MTKVLFTFGGLPHYYNSVLNRLNSIDNLEISVVVPEKKTNTIGNGVKLNNSDINFNVIYLEEKKSVLGKYYLDKLLKVVKQEKPDIIVTIWPYIIDLVTDPLLHLYIKREKIKTIIKEIPFDVPRCEDALKYYCSDYALRLNEDMVITEKLNFAFYIKHFCLKFLRKYYYGKFLDASVNYIEDAYDICSSYGMKKESIFITTNSLDTDKLNSLYMKISEVEPVLPKNPYRIIHIGRLVKWKGVDLLINAVNILKSTFPSIELLIIGTGKEIENLKSQVISLNLIENVRFLGGVYDDFEIGRYLDASSIYVLAGMGGLSINQAMSFGKPVICTIADGTEKLLVRDGYNGYYFKDGDVSDLSEKIEKLLSDPQKLIDFGNNSFSIIKDEVNIDRVIEKYLEAFEYVKSKN